MADNQFQAQLYEIHKRAQDATAALIKVAISYGTKVVLLVNSKSEEAAARAFLEKLGYPENTCPLARVLPNQDENNHPEHLNINFEHFLL